MTRWEDGEMHFTKSSLGFSVLELDQQLFLSSLSYRSGDNGETPADRTGKGPCELHSESLFLVLIKGTSNIINRGNTSSDPVLIAYV